MKIRLEFWGIVAGQVTVTSPLALLGSVLLLLIRSNIAFQILVFALPVLFHFSWRWLFAKWVTWLVSKGATDELVIKCSKTGLICGYSKVI